MTIYAGHVLLTIVVVFIIACAQITHFRLLRLHKHYRQESDLLFMLREQRRFEELQQWELMAVIEQDISHHREILRFIGTPHPWWWALTKQPLWQRQLAQLRQEEGAVFTCYGELMSQFINRTHGPKLED